MRTHRLVKVVVFLVLSFLIFLGTGYAAWTPFSEISDTSTYKYATTFTPNSKNIVLDDIGGVTYVHAVYEEGREIDFWGLAPLYYGVFLRSGFLNRHTNTISFLLPQQIAPGRGEVTTGNYWGFPAVAVDKDHNIHMVWETSSHRSDSGMYDNYEVYYNKLTYQNTNPPTWVAETPRRLSERPLYSGTANLCCDAEGNAHIVFVDAGVDSGNWQGFNNIYYCYIENNGQVTNIKSLTDEYSEKSWIAPEVAVWSELVSGTYKHHVYTAWSNVSLIPDQGSISSHGHLFFREYDPVNGWLASFKIRDVVQGGISTPTSVIDNEISPSLVLVLDPQQPETNQPKISLFYSFYTAFQAWIGLSCFDRVQDNSWYYTEIIYPRNTGLDYYVDGVDDGNGGCHVYFRAYNSGKPSLFYLHRDAQGVFGVPELVYETATPGDPIYAMGCITQDSHGWLHVLANKMGWVQNVPSFGVYYSNDGGMHSSRSNSLAKKRTPKKQNKSLTALAGNEVIALISTAEANNSGMVQKKKIKGFFLGKNWLNLDKKDIKKPKVNPRIEENQIGSQDAANLVQNKVSLDSQKICNELSLKCAPNPAITSTNLTISLPTTDHISLTIYDLSGRCVANLLDGEMQAGVYNVQWTAANATPGVYLSRLECGDMIIVKKLVVSR